MEIDHRQISCLTEKSKHFPSLCLIMEKPKREIVLNSSQDWKI